jgi:hypothetical protein
MDWTSVFDEDGTEEIIIPHLMEQKPTAPRLSRLVSKIYHRLEEDEVFDSSLSEGHRLLEFDDLHRRQYSLRDLYYLSINFILGVGCLGIPYAFARAGFLLCSCILLTVTLFSYMTVLWVAETGARFEKQIKASVEGGISLEQSPLLTRRTSQEKTNLIIEEGRYEVIDLVDYYLGRFQKIIYQISLMALMYVGLLAYSQVFCGAIAALIWGESGAVGKAAWGFVPQIIFGIMVVPLSCLELDEQITVQSIMANVRFVAIFVMVFGSLLALWIDGSESNYSHPPYWAPAEPENCEMSYTACFSGFGVAFSTSLFSQLFQHSVPGLLRPLRGQPEKLPKVPITVGASLLTTSSFYLLLGMTASAYFGAKTRSSINLNFAHFTFGVDPVTTSPLITASLRFASNIVVMFPALDTISVFPLIANTLGNNLYSAAGPEFIKGIARWKVWYQSGLERIQNGEAPRTGRRYSSLPLEERKRVLETASKISTIFWRLVSALPPLLGSLVATDLSLSLLLSGVAGIYVAFYAPSLLHLESSRQMAGETIYSGWYSRTIFCYPVLIFATFSLGISLFQIRQAIVDGL